MMGAMTRFGYATLRGRRHTTTFMFILDQVIVSTTIIERKSVDASASATADLSPQFNVESDVRK
jgi:hypothetical protein